MDEPLENLVERDTTMGTERSARLVKPRLGVLALQGDFAAHAEILRGAGAQAREVRTPAQLDGLHGLILPGGESTTLLRLLRLEGLDHSLREFHARGGALFGTCAGLILLASEVILPEQESLGLLDVTVERNAFGRQIDSFVAQGSVSLADSPETESAMEMVFIRAPRIRRVGRGVRVLGRLGEEPVLVQSGRILAATFHPEVARDPRVHRYFIGLLNTTQ